MTATYEKIATTTLGSAAATITLSSISSAYTDLIVIFRGGCSVATGVYLQFNADTGSNYSFTKIYGFGTGLGSSRSSNQTKGEVGGSWSSNDVIILNIQNYANTTTYKSTVWRQSDASDTVASGVTLWRSTSAINEIKFLNDATNFVSGTNVTIYGIKAE